MKLIKYRNYSREDIHNIYSPDSKFVRGAGKWGLHGIISIPNKKADFIFFVTFGTTEAGHSFDEGITGNGTLTWQSKPAQKLSDPQINTFINHDHNNNNIYLLLRTNSKSKYTYLGKLAYKSHDPNKEKPVRFQWKILEWEIKNDLFENIGLKLGYSEKNKNSNAAKTKLKSKNQLIKSEIPFSPKKKRNIGKQGNKIVKIDFIEKAISSQKIGKKGELLVVEYEKERLKKLGLNKRITHVSLEGDGHGYDIESYNENGEKIFIEVKTTQAGKNTSFDVSSNEVLVSEDKGNFYYIYRLYDYSETMNSAKFYVINGPISKHFNLQATQYIATFKGKK